ncbi:MAG: Clp protease ClpP [Verrucomicrobiota bacterium]
MKFPLQPSFAILAGATAKKYGVAVKAAEGDSPAEILIHGPIGRSFWSADGITGKEFIDALNKFPVGEKVTIGINSQGGAVGEGLAIFNAIQRRAADITCRIDGYAISIASVIPLAAGKVVSPKSSIWMIHNAWSWFDGGQGNAEDMRHIAEMAKKAADMLDKHDDVLVAAYVARSGKKDEEIRNAMAEETWLTGEEAVEWGLADEVSDDAADLEALDFSGMEAKAFKKIPLNCRSLILAAAKTPISALPPQGKAQTKNQTEENSMNRAQRIALLNGWGVMVKDEASLTDARIEELIAMGKTAALAAFKGESAPAPAASNVVHITMADVDAAVSTAVQSAAQAAEKRAEVKSTLAQLVTERRITQAQADKWLPAALKDDSVVATLKENPVMPEAAAPVAQESEISVDASPKETVLALARFDKPMESFQRGNGVSMKELSKASMERAHFIEKNAKKMLPALAANAVPAGLQRSVILQTIVKDFARKVIPITLFATKFENVPLEGTNKVEVPYYDLDGSASTSFKGSDGYVAGNTATGVREIQVGKRADADVLDNTKQYDRKYQGLSFTSEEMARQPWLKKVELASLKAEKLASDIVAHILSIVTAAKFGAAVKTEDADTFDSDDVIDIKLACKLWPDMGRILLLDSAYDANLMKDPGFKNAFAAASDRAIKEGKLFPRVFGFDYSEYPTIPENDEKLVGFAAFKSAIGVAFAPVPPIEEVRKAGTTYQIYTDPVSEAVLEYRAFGDNQMDTGSHFIESSYGFERLLAGALKRICRP